MIARFVPCICLFAIEVVAAQPLPPNGTGVSFGNFQFNEGAPAAPFWAAVVGKPQGVIRMGRISVLTFPDSGFHISLVSQKPTGGTSGSVIDHLGLRVKNLPDTLARVRAAGFKVEQDPGLRRAYLYGPDELKIEVIEDPLIAMPVQWDHIHFYSEAPEQMRSWYEKMLGALSDDSGSAPAADLPGIRLVFSKSEAAMVPTKGRVLDGIQFSIVDAVELRAKLLNEGAALEREPHFVPPQKSIFVQLTDPWGTYIELREMPAPR